MITLALRALSIESVEKIDYFAVNKIIGGKKLYSVESIDHILFILGIEFEHIDMIHNLETIHELPSVHNNNYIFKHNMP